MLEQSPSPNMSGPILVIDDEPYILRSLSYLLQREGYTVETATNGAEGLQRVRSLRPPALPLAWIPTSWTRSSNASHWPSKMLRCIAPSPIAARTCSAPTPISRPLTRNC